MVLDCMSGGVALFLLLLLLPLLFAGTMELFGVGLVKPVLPGKAKPTFLAAGRSG